MPTPTFTPVSLLDTIGRTPLLRLERLPETRPRSRSTQGGVPEPWRFGEGPRGGGDRSRCRTIVTASAGGTILDATSGNTGSCMR